MRSLGSLSLLLISFLLPLSAQEQGLQANPADDLFDLAQLAYREALDTEDKNLRQANYQVAERQFARFLIHHSNHPKALEALYYSAGCHDALGQIEEAVKRRKQILVNWNTGKLVGLSALQLATYHYYTKQDFEKAAPLYRKAAKLAEPASAKQLAQYQLALSLQKTDQEQETITALEKVVADGNSPYFTKAQRALAHYYRNGENKEEAYNLYLQLMESEDPKTKAEATQQASLLAYELKKDDDELVSLFEKALANRQLKNWHTDAALFLMSKAAKNEDYEKVITYSKGVGNLGKDKEKSAKFYLLKAKAHEKNGEERMALSAYRQLANNEPSTETGLNASYYVVSKYYNKNEGFFLMLAENFLTNYQKAFSDNPKLDNVRLMLAETKFKNKELKAAAKLYQNINVKNLDPENHPEVRYRLVSVLRTLGDEKGASKALDEFIKHHRDDLRAAHALTQRGDASKEANRFEEALQDYDLVLSLTKEERPIEYAWVQKAAIYKKQRNLPALIEAHHKLLELFPDRSAKATAASHFWIGWALFRQEKYQESVNPLATARELDVKTFGKEATVQLCLAHYSLQQIKELQREVDRLHEKHPAATLPQNLYAWLGASLTADHKFSKAWKYLPKAIDWENPSQIKNTIWLSYARAAQETGNYEEAIRAYQLLLKDEENPFRRADYLYEIARTHFSNKQLDRSLEKAQEALALKPQGGLNGKIRFLLGAIASSLGDDDSALQHYVVVIELYNEDADSRHRALEAAIPILEKKGTPDDLTQAERYQKLLKSP